METKFPTDMTIVLLIQKYHGRISGINNILSKCCMPIRFICDEIFVFCSKFAQVTLQDGAQSPPDWIVRFKGAEITQYQNSDPTLAYGILVVLFCVSKWKLIINNIWYSHQGQILYLRWISKETRM